MAEPRDQDDVPSREPGFTPVDKLAELSPRQKKEVREKSRPNAALIHETIRSEGIGELEREPWALALSALAAGLSMGFSMVVEGKLESLLPPGPARALISPLGYAVGFLIVVLGRQQLFTENTLTPVLPLLHDRSMKTFGLLLRLWAVVLAANIMGACLFAWAAAWTPVFDSAMARAFSDLGREAIKAAFVPTFLRAILAGWLIALMVWLLPAADSARSFVIIAITYVVGLGAFPHVIAGSVECAFLAFSGQASWGEIFTRFFMPTLLGNMLGGVALVAVLNYGQVAPEVEEGANEPNGLSNVPSGRQGGPDEH
jgi:formate/nitrite transporter FocA (FNT family)